MVLLLLLRFLWNCITFYIFSCFLPCSTGMRAGCLLIFYIPCSPPSFSSSSNFQTRSKPGLIKSKINYSLLCSYLTSPLHPLYFSAYTCILFTWSLLLLLLVVVVEAVSLSVLCHSLTVHQTHIANNIHVLLHSDSCWNTPGFQPIFSALATLITTPCTKW